MRMLVWSLLLVYAALGVGNCCTLAEDLRNYEEGPLTIADFLGTPPADPPGSANTVTQLGCNYRYSYRVVGTRTTLTVERVMVDAYIRRDASWNRLPSNTALLEHEQGHADNAWIACLQARIAFRDKLRRGRVWKVTGVSLKDAVSKLDAEVSEIMQPFEDAGREADAEYDRETRHGLGPRQGEWRRVQAGTIEELTASLERR